MKGTFCRLNLAEAKKLSKTMIHHDIASDLAETFAALGDATRVRMLDLLSRKELCVHDLAGMLEMTPSAVSHQLRYLRALRLVKCRKDGKNTLYLLDDEHVVTLFGEGLEHVRHR